MVWNFCCHSTDDQSTSIANLHILTSPLINICSLWEYRRSKLQHWSHVHQILCWIKVGFKLVEKGGIEVLLPQYLWSFHKHSKFTHPDVSFDQYMFVLRISTFEMTALVSCTSNTMLDKSRLSIGGERRYWSFVARVLLISPQATKIYFTSWWPI